MEVMLFGRARGGVFVVAETAQPSLTHCQTSLLCVLLEQTDDFIAARGRVRSGLALWVKGDEHFQRIFLDVIPNSYSDYKRSTPALERRVALEMGI